MDKSREKSYEDDRILKESITFTFICESFREKVNVSFKEVTQNNILPMPAFSY